MHRACRQSNESAEMVIATCAAVFSILRRTAASLTDFSRLRAGIASSACIRGNPEFLQLIEMLLVLKALMPSAICNTAILCLGINHDRLLKYVVSAKLEARPRLPTKHHYPPGIAMDNTGNHAPSDRPRSRLRLPISAYFPSSLKVNLDWDTKQYQCRHRRCRKHRRLA